MKTLNEFAIQMTSMLDDEAKIALTRHTFLTIMKAIESDGYTVRGDDCDAIEEDLLRFFDTKDGTHCAMSMLQFTSSISATPSDHGIGVGGDDCPFNRNVNVTLN